MPNFNRFQSVGAQARQQPFRVLGLQGTDLVESIDLFLGEREFYSGKIVLKLVEALCANDDGGDHRLGQQPGE